MAVFDVTEACGYLGKTVLVELVFDDPDDGQIVIWSFVQIAGVVLALEGVYQHPHFMVFSASECQQYPDEMFWSDIRTIKVLDARSMSRKNRRT